MKMRTALVRTESGNLKVMRYDDYKTQKEMADDLRANGFKVLKIWNEDKPTHEIEAWEYLNRKN